MVLRLTNKTNEIPVEDFDFKFWHFDSYISSVVGRSGLQSKQAAQKKAKLSKEASRSCKRWKSKQILNDCEITEMMCQMVVKRLWNDWYLPGKCDREKLPKGKFHHKFLDHEAMRSLKRNLPTSWDESNFFIKVRKFY